ncbi:MAG: SURF1 family protein [Rhodobacteraceae bacterium]|nr:SURF1 family protein [Paracoccaceae bacterium]
MRRVLFLILFGFAGTGVLVSLGLWQVQRLTWKQSVITEIEAQIDADPVALPDDPDPRSDKYLPVFVTGTIEPSELHVLVSLKRVGAGYRIIAPFLTDDGRRILLDRGFTKTTNRSANRSIGPATITGNLHWPQEIDKYTPEPDADIWFARDVPAMATALDTLPILLISVSKTDETIIPLPVDTSRIPNDHLQYAITWFSLALIWATMTTYYMWRTRASAQFTRPKGQET